MNRRRFLRRASGMGAALGLGSAFWQRAFSQTAQPGPSPYGPLRGPDANGLMLPEGFTSRIVAKSFEVVPGTGYQWHIFPDGGACVPTDDGGWVYVSNSEFPPPVDVPGVTGLLAQVQQLTGRIGLPISGGVSAIRFDAEGRVVDAYPILTGTQSNCAGGLTPWGTWLSCEEWESDATPYLAGRVWECDPFGTPDTAVDRPALGRFKHEMAAVDPVDHRIYLSEDQEDGLFYRYTPPPGVWGSGDALEGGTMEAMAVARDGSVTWIPVPDAHDPKAPLRETVKGATHFRSGEGCVYDDGRVYLTCKPPADQVWVHDIEAGTMEILYEAGRFGSPVLSGVDNITASASHDLYVAEDGGNLEVCMITPDLTVAPVVRMTGIQHGFEVIPGVPTISEVTGLAFSPDGNRLYFNSERGIGGLLPLGILYEVTGPFRGGTLAEDGGTTPTTTTATTAPPTTSTPVDGDGRGGRGHLPATGPGTDPLGPAAVATAAAALLWKLRQRTEPDA